MVSGKVIVAGRENERMVEGLPLKNDVIWKIDDEIGFFGFFPKRRLAIEIGISTGTILPSKHCILLSKGTKYRALGRFAVAACKIQSAITDLPPLDRSNLNASASV